MTENKENGWAVLKRLVSYIKEFKLALFGGIVGMIGYAVVDMALIWSLQPLIDDGFTGKDPSVYK